MGSDGGFEGLVLYSGGEKDWEGIRWLSGFWW